MRSMKSETEGVTRRNFVAGAAAALAGSAGLAGMAHGAVQNEDKELTPIETMNTYGRDLLNMMVLRTYPIAIKMLKDESGIPQGAVRPKKDLGEHYAACQAFALARQRGRTLAMFIEDHWCFEPIIGYGLVEPPQDFLDGSGSAFFVQDKEAARKRTSEIPLLPYGRYAGMVLGPLHKANYEPDLTVIYCNATQLRHMLFALMLKNGYRVTSTLDPIWSCVHSVVPSLLTGECEVTVPDPGEYERGATRDDEMMLTIPNGKMTQLMDGVYHYEKMGMGYRSFGRELKGDFQQPPFYRQYFQQWGLDEPK
ncbi:MAG: DUF169 domain-containing protein [Acidobacteria bacterium]|nr:DUF169 domain-containing protein [Acidobacteriota bacterium]